uniref:Uncharacterized protein n=1 Tax=viral metagenome TaxID=1070528 RepID=A0A6C0JPM4_9ZZZZ
MGWTQSYCILFFCHPESELVEKILKFYFKECKKKNKRLLFEDKYYKFNDDIRYRHDYRIGYTDYYHLGENIMLLNRIKLDTCRSPRRYTQSGFYLFFIGASFCKGVGLDDFIDEMNTFKDKHTKMVISNDIYDTYSKEYDVIRTDEYENEENFLLYEDDTCILTCKKKIIDDFLDKNILKNLINELDVLAPDHVKSFKGGKEFRSKKDDYQSKHIF